MSEITKKIAKNQRVSKLQWENPNSLSLIIAVSALAVVLNVLGGTFVEWLKIPVLFLDAVGTIFIAATFGVRWGILVGVVTNLVLGITTGPTSIPFALVQVAIAVIVGGFTNLWGYKLKTAIVAGLVTAVVAPAIGSSIAVIVFGGLTGGALDVFTLWLAKSGEGIFAASFIPRFGSNLVDKIASALIVYAIVRNLPRTLIKPRYRASEVQDDVQTATADAPAATSDVQTTDAI